MVCQKDWKKEPTLCAVSMGAARNGGPRRSECMSYDCAMVSTGKGALERVRVRAALWWFESKSSRECGVVGERRCKSESRRVG